MGKRNARRSRWNACLKGSLRFLAWLVVMAAVNQAGTHPGPGGAMLGIALAATLATYLRATRNQARRPRGNRP